MALDALWAVLIAEVSGVSKVQAPIHAGLRDTPAVLPEVSRGSSSDSGSIVAAMLGGDETFDTPMENVRYQAQPAWALGCTLDTPDTPEKINVGIHATDDLAGDLLTGWNVYIPPGTSVPDSWALQHPVAYTLIWAVGILAVFVPLANYQYRRAASR